MGSYRQFLRTVGAAGSANSAEFVDKLRTCVTGFAAKLQKRYPFEFVLSRRGVVGERNRQRQERLVTQFILTALIETSALDPKLRSWALELTKRLVTHIGTGGENFTPKEFTDRESALARAIGSVEFSRFLIRAHALSESWQMNLGPVNQLEHSIAWSFRYLGQLLKVAEWEAVEH